jgi:hypothetical protein
MSNTSSIPARPAARSLNVATVKFVARWDRDGSGVVYPDIEITDYPDWMSIETLRAIERDIADDMIGERAEHSRSSREV